MVTTASPTCLALSALTLSAAHAPEYELCNTLLCENGDPIETVLINFCVSRKSLLSCSTDFLVLITASVLNAGEILHGIVYFGTGWA